MYGIFNDLWWKETKVGKWMKELVWGHSLVPFKNDSVQKINLVPNLTKPNTNEQQHVAGIYLNSILNFILLLYFV